MSAARAVLQPKLWPTDGTRCHLRRAADAAGRERGRASPARPAGTPRPASPTPARRKRRWPRHAARSCSGTQGSTGGVSGPARIVVRSEDGREPWDACFASPCLFTTVLARRAPPAGPQRTSHAPRQTGAQRPITGAAAREHRQRAAFRPVRVTCAEVDDPQQCMRPAMSPAGAPGRPRARAIRCAVRQTLLPRKATTAS